jgi:hypothetical protein
MKRKRTISLLLAALLLAAMLGACGSETLEPELGDVVGRIDDALGGADSMMAVNEDYVKGSMRMDVASYEGYTVKINAYGANVDEYGVFRAADENQAKEIKMAVEEYLQMRVDTWMEAYMPEEKPKVTSSEIVTEGNYVCYAILSEEQKADVFDAFRASFEK